MKNSFGRRLRYQLILAFVLIFTGVMLFTVILTYRRTADNAQQISARMTQQFFKQNEYSISSFASEIDGIMKLLSQSEDVADYLKTGWSNDFDTLMQINDITAETGRLLENHDYVASVFYYSDDGVILGTNSRENIVRQERNQEEIYYTSGMMEAAGEDPWSTLWFGGMTSDDFAGAQSLMPETTSYITIVRSINLVGRHIGAVVVNIEEEVLAELISHADDKRERETFLIDASGNIIVHENPEKIGSQLSLAEAQSSTETYYLEDGYQVNYRRLEGISGMNWTLVSKIPLSLLYADLYSLRRNFILVFVIALTAGCGLSMYWLRRMTKPLDELREAMMRMENGELGGQLQIRSENELGMLGQEFNKMSRSIEELVEQVQTAEEEKRILEQQALQSQINPHFLFNTLTNIKYMAMIVKSNTIADSITTLGNFLAPVFKSDRDMWAISDEIDYIDNSIKIMNYRFGGKIRVNYLCDEGNRNLYILKFVLQPLVENAISHGFENSEGQGNIEIRFEAGEELVITVEDDGKGLSEEELTRLREKIRAYETGPVKQKGHIGLSNVNRRLKVHYGEGYGIQVTSRESVGTAVMIHMPLLQEPS